jgi:hypothetical protein
MLAQFIESLTQEQTKLIQMDLMKDPKAHALTMHDGKGSSKQNEKEGCSKLFNDSSSSKDSVTNRLVTTTILVTGANFFFCV